jgi:hypothetical protein
MVKSSFLVSLGSQEDVGVEPTGQRCIRTHLTLGGYGARKDQPNILTGRNNLVVSRDSVNTSVDKPWPRGLVTLDWIRSSCSHRNRRPALFITARKHSAAQQRHG